MDMKYSFEKLVGKPRPTRAKLHQTSDNDLNQLGKDVAKYLNALLTSWENNRRSTEPMGTLRGALEGLLQKPDDDYQAVLGLEAGRAMDEQKLLIELFSDVLQEEEAELVHRGKGQCLLPRREEVPSRAAQASATLR
jgi:transcriptional regulator with XRE-family HTH domain